MSRMANSEHQTASVLVSLRANEWWVEDFQFHVPSLHSVSSGDDLYWDVISLQRLEHQRHARRVLLGEARCRGYLADRETLQQGEHPVIVIEVRVRQEDFI